MIHNGSSGDLDWSRRDFMRTAALAGLAGFAGIASAAGQGEETVSLPFENGERPLVKYPQKRPLIRLTTRPPQLETPFSVFNEGALTPNDAFFVRYHLTLSPPSMEALGPEKFRLDVSGKVKTPLTLSVAELKSQFVHEELPLRKGVIAWGHVIDLAPCQRRFRGTTRRA